MTEATKQYNKGFFLGVLIGCIISVLTVHILIRNFKPVETVVDLPEEYKVITPNTPIYGEYRNDTLHIHFNHAYDNAVKINPEYMIELINQDSIKISNGTEVKTIPFGDISEYIMIDNL